MRSHTDLSASFTDRELQILHLLAVGMPDKAVAAVLDISERTVRKHVANCRLKACASNRTILMALLVQRDVLSVYEEATSNGVVYRL